MSIRTTNMYSFESIAIEGHGGRPIPNTFFKLSSPSDKLAMVFPGRGYTSQGPLLYYTIGLLLENRVNVLSVDYRYSAIPEFVNLEWEDRMQWILEDVEAAYKAAKQHIDARLSVLVGKSLGTLGIGHLLSKFDDTRRARIIWHTPLLRIEGLVRQIKENKPSSLIVIGTDDPHYDTAVLDSVIETTGASTIIIDDADHSMDIRVSVRDSIEAMSRIIEKIKNFLCPVDRN
ncbi:MAG: hypothetical protein JSW61_14585 [Candidatus Thorarchaeota archaeon]|nr:MAG: hypothetical protein JSW61_14585 [Candidatus Thorarchaeota archaeon]